VLCFLTKIVFDHYDSKDTDIVLKPTIMMNYKSIRKTIEKTELSINTKPLSFLQKSSAPHRAL